MKVVVLRRCLFSSTLPLVLMSFVGEAMCTLAWAQAEATTEAFSREVKNTLPPENLYDYHKRLSGGPVHTAQRDPDARAKAGELTLPERGWKLVWNHRSSPVLQGAVRDFHDYLDKSMQVRVEVVGRDSLAEWQSLGRSIVVGTREQMPGCGTALKGPKDYEILATPERLTVCGYDERGAMYGLYNLEARMRSPRGALLARESEDGAAQSLRRAHHRVLDGLDGVAGFAACATWPMTVLTASLPPVTPIRMATAPRPNRRPSFTRACCSRCAVRIRPGCAT